VLVVGQAGGEGVVERRPAAHQHTTPRTVSHLDQVAEIRIEYLNRQSQPPGRLPPELHDRRHAPGRCGLARRGGRHACYRPAGCPAAPLAAGITRR
jgi:hypothetical protein